MKVMNKILVLVLILVFAGCANMSAEKKSCVIKSTIAGAVFGGGAGAAAGKPGGTINRGEGAGIGAASGALIGGLLGVAFCEDAIDTDGDGVIDSCDKCPNTPPGCPVDENGCATDTDGDGVKDCVDKCPNTPKGCKPVDENGCAKDTDGDGVKDCVDKCPNTPKNCKPVDKNGCAKDTDGDGVKDCVDKCPDTPKGVKVDANGCSMVGEELLIIYGINFAFDSAAIDEGSKIRFSRGIESLKKNKYIKVRIEGHTDSVGDADYNMGLSIRRAQAVKDYAVSQGIAANRLSIKGLGETDPIADNNTELGRKKNRRVEFVVTEKQKK
jgi:OOP family OmpA-OmpF porin